MKIFPVLALFLTLTSCALFKPAGASNAAGVVSPQMKALLTANDPGLKYPVYASFSEIEPLLQRKDDNITYVINFWATWCRPCITEMAFFEQLTNETSRNDVQVVMISLDKPEDVRSKMKDFVESRPLNLPVVAFTDNFYDGWIYKVDQQWQRSSIPVTLFYRNGQRYFNRGQISSYRELEGLVARVQ
ncbi:TlpA disulfide reductase family protein [Neolewinella aurantiaca]|nr:TlpA disulfide reductase family protein [Neolewinella aurantiaca]